MKRKKPKKQTRQMLIEKQMLSPEEYFLIQYLRTQNRTSDQRWQENVVPY